MRWDSPSSLRHFGQGFSGSGRSHMTSIPSLQTGSRTIHTTVRLLRGPWRSPEYWDSAVLDSSKSKEEHTALWVLRRDLYTSYTST